MATYVISDVHSNLDKFTAFLNDITSEDRVYCLGDVIDKGQGDIQVLRMVREDPRFVMLLGNHELMMLEMLKAQEDLEDGFTVSKYNDYTDKKSLWLRYNGGKKTYEAFLQLEREEQKAIRDYIDDLPILLNIEVNGRKFCLVHSYPFNEAENDVYYKDIDNPADYVWQRIPYVHIDGSIVVTGHTIVQYAFGSYEVETDGLWYDIDMGCAMQNEYSRLAALKLDDLSVRYY